LRENDELLLGIDIGTSSVKVSLFNLNGDVLGIEDKEYPTYRPKLNWVEQNPEDWWDALCLILHKLFKRESKLAKRIIAIGVSGHSWGCCALSSRGSCIRPSIIWMDRRAINECEFIMKTIDLKCPISIDPSYIFPKILWLKNSEPENYADTYKFVNVNSYINYRLTGSIISDFSQEDPFQIAIRTLSSGETKSICEDLGISYEKIPLFLESSQIIGSVTKQASIESGLRVGIPVIAGAMDTSAASLAVGAINTGQAMYAVGQAGAIVACTKEPYFDSRLCIHTHVVPNSWLVGGVSVATGASLRWFRDILLKGRIIRGDNISIKIFKEQNIFKRLDQEAEAVNSNFNGPIFLPYMSGERSPIWNPNARGVFFGLSLATKRGDLARSIMEGTSFAFKHNLDIIDSIGLSPSKIFVCGGAAKSSIWNQIRADVIGKSLEVMSGEGASAGVAMLAGVGVGAYSSIEDATKHFVKEGYLFNPVESRHAIYSKRYKIYRSLSEKMEELFNSFSQVGL